MGVAAGLGAEAAWAVQLSEPIAWSEAGQGHSGDWAMLLLPHPSRALLQRGQESQAFWVLGDSAQTLLPPTHVHTHVDTHIHA